MMRIVLPKFKWNRVFIYVVVSLSLFFGLYRIYATEGVGNNPPFVLIRLEDIGPGGYYDSLEGLGKLRAVLEFLHRQQVPYGLSVIPRWVNLFSDGKRYDRSLDQLDKAYIQSFDKLLQQAIQEGASLGMHGYTHQVGDTLRNDGHHASGVGNEFNVPGLTETTTNSFAEKRVNEGLRIFRDAGFVPRYWEAPHYHTTEEQNQVFQAYFGLLYQPHKVINPNPPEAQYTNLLNGGYGASSMGAVYVPTPFSYIPNNKDEKVILNQIGKSRKVPSLFFHPFLEFKHLIPVVDSLGKVVLRDGLPDYKYPEDNKSMLQKLIAQFKSMGFEFYSIHDYVPFTPAHRVEVGSKQDTNLQIGDVTGKGQADIVTWDKKSDNIKVVEGQFKGMRNETQLSPKVWTTIPYSEGAAFTLNDTNGDHTKGLWVVYPSGKLESYASDGTKFTHTQTWKIPSNRWFEVHELQQPNGDCVLSGKSQDHSQLLGVYMHKGQVKSIKPYKFESHSANELLVRNLNKEGMQGFFIAKKDSSNGMEINFDTATLQWKTKKVHLNIPSEPGEIRFGDFNGDGKQDIVRWDANKLTFTVYLQAAENEYKLLSVFGPWGSKDSRLFVADFDGNGKNDIAMKGQENSHMDIALSYQSKNISHRLR